MKKSTRACKGQLFGFKEFDYIVFGVTEGLGKPRGEPLLRFPPVLYHEPLGILEGIKKVAIPWSKIEKKFPILKTYEIWGTYPRVNFHEMLHWLGYISGSKKNWINIQPTSFGIFEADGLKFFFYYIDLQIDTTLEETFTTEETFSAQEEDEYINEDDDQ
jgi:hypothetical protein